MSNIPNCAKCGKPLTGNVKIANGKRYHQACAPTPSVNAGVVSPTEVQKTAPPPPPEPPGVDQDAAPNGRLVVPATSTAKAPASEMRHVMYFTWQSIDGTVFNSTVRGSDFKDFVDEFNAALEWIINQGGVLVNTGRSQYAEAPKTQTATQGNTPATPRVPGQTRKFTGDDGVTYMVGQVKEMAVKFLDKSKKFVVSVKVPPFLQFGVNCWEEVAVPIFGDLSKLSLTENLTITDEMKYVVFTLREDGRPGKVVEFRSSPG